MSNKPRNFGTSIPEMRDNIMKYGCRLSDEPIYVLLGKYRSDKMGPVYGILAAANNEFHAHLLRREFNKGGSVDVMRTEHHPDGLDISIEMYKKKMREAQERRKTQ